MPRPAAIKLIDVVKHFEKGLVKAVNGVNLTVGPGAILALTGPSGCGKTTLLNLIGALDRPTGGRIEIDGRGLDDLGPLHAYRAKHIGFVFQAHHLIPSLTLLENVETPLVPTKISKTERRERSVALLREMGLEQRMSFLPGRVSGGERQRAAIARAMVNWPKILLCDEPTGGVDAPTGRRVMDYILSVGREKGITVILATHNPEIAALADGVIRLEDGRIMSGTSEAS
ncbi:MAG: ABC transporter ATP-binding protein [Pseudomonadota bacterium]